MNKAILWRWPANKLNVDKNYFFGLACGFDLGACFCGLLESFLGLFSCAIL